jgi:hypothetical protein
MQVKRIFQYLWGKQALQAPLMAMGIFILLPLAWVAQGWGQVLMHFALNGGVL